MEPSAGPDSGRRRPGESLWGFLRRYWRLWGFLGFLLFVVVLFRSIAMPFVFALLLAYLLAPTIRRMEARMRRGFAVVVVYLGIFGAFAAFFGILVPAVAHDLAKLRETAPKTLATAEREWLPKATKWVDENLGGLGLTHPAPPKADQPSSFQVVPNPDGSYTVDLSTAQLDVEETAEGAWVIRGRSETEAPEEALRRLVALKGSEVTTVLGHWLRIAIAGIAGLFTKVVITFMLAAFILIDMEKVGWFARSLVPPEYRDNFDELLSGMDRGLAGVIRGQLLICTVNGLLTFVGLVILGIKYSVLLGLLAGVFSLVPIFGTILSSIPIVLVALVSREGGIDLTPALLVMAWIAGIHLLEANYLNPKIIGDSAHIHPVVVVFALLAGEHVYGLTGALLAVPVASMVQTAFLYARRHSSAFQRDTDYEEPPQSATEAPTTDSEKP